MNKADRKEEVRIKYDLIGKLSAAFGSFILFFSIILGIIKTLNVWSPTYTASNCFYFPNSLRDRLPDKTEINQFLLTESFFGTDSLYFDKGEENTGKAELITSKTSDKTPPQDSISVPNEILKDTDIYSYDYSKRREGELALLPYDLSGKQPKKLLFSNTTSYDIDPNCYTEQNYPIKSNLSDKPLVLIVHTHGTESFAPEGELSVSSNSARSSDIENNIVAVGKVMAEMLNNAGIVTLHCETMHDLTSYRASYDLCADTVRDYLAKYPSIQYVFDVHRDAVVKENGDIIKPVCNIDGELSAQIMLLVGTNEKGADHPNWEDNLTVAIKLQSKLVEKYENFARPINIRGASFNQQFTSGSLLIEIGSSGNTLSEAKNAARQLTYSIIEMIEETSEKEN